MTFIHTVKYRKNAINNNNFFDISLQDLCLKKNTIQELPYKCKNPSESLIYDGLYDGTIYDDTIYDGTIYDGTIFINFCNNIVFSISFSKFIM